MYAIREAVRGVSRTPYMTMISIVTITVTLTVLGVFGIITLFSNGLMYKIRKSEEINIYIKDDLSDEDMLALDAVIAAMKEIESTRILSKEDAAKEFEKMFGSGLLNALEKNPLPRTIVVVLAEGYRMSDDIETVIARISKSYGVESVEYGREWMSKMDILFIFFVIAEAILIALAVAACILVISNTISMTVLARRETIEIMRLVGATDGFIRRPFYIEGLLQGLVSGIVSFCILYGSYRWIIHAVPDINTYIFMFIVPGQIEFLKGWSSIIIIPLGGMLGLFGSYAAVRRVF